MIILKIASKGHYIEIPGMPPFRTPVEANISHISIPLVVSTLKSNGINKFEIYSDTKGKEKKLTQKDFIDKKSQTEDTEDYKSRFNRLEFLMNKLIEKQVSDNPENKEQITNRLNSIEKLIKKTETKVIVSKEKDKEPKIEEIDDIFIPNIDLDGLEMKGKSSQKKVEQDNIDIDDNADLLSRIVQSE